VSRYLNAGKLPVLAIALCATAATQMNTAEVSGVVQDMTGGAIAHAAIRRLMIMTMPW
jgi:hypothetical protein